LRIQWLNEDDMAALFSPVQGSPDWPAFFYFFGKLLSAGFVNGCFNQNDEPFFSIHPARNQSVFGIRKPGPEKRYRLSKFALIRQDNGKMVLESALTPCRFIIHKKELATCLFDLCSGATPDTSQAGWDIFLAALLSAEILEAIDSEQKGRDNPLDVWEFHDLLFYSRTQKGRHLLPIGGTYRFAGKRNSPPVVKSPASDEIIALNKPDGILSEKLDQPFGRILENRRSLRKYGPAPISLEELGAFLFSSSRIQTIVHDGAHGEDVSLRPSPSGGARHALEIYPFIRKCENCEPGIYRYRPQEHVLEKIKSSGEPVQKLLNWNPHKIVTSIAPHVTLYLSARVERMSWKYESIAYKLIQQDLGCLYQTFYLVAEALGLCPCALGDVDTVLLGQVLEIDWRTEPFIGGFTLRKKHHE